MTLKNQTICDRKFLKFWRGPGLHFVSG